MSTRLLGMTLACASMAATTLVLAQSDEAERVNKSATVLQEIMSAPDKAIPASVLKKAEAIAVFPGTIKGGLGRWRASWQGHRERSTPPIRQVVQSRIPHHDRRKLRSPDRRRADRHRAGRRNKAGIDKLLADKFKVGGDASVAAGPVGRGTEASTDIKMTAEILSYSRARGLFAGVSLEGSSITEDDDANQRYYGRAVHNREITGLTGKPVGTSGATSAAGAEPGSSVLDKYTK